MKISWVLIFILFFTGLISANKSVCSFNNDDLIRIIQKDSIHWDVIPEDSIKKTVKGKRIKAIILTILTGPLGGHRIYLGTKAAVPVLYSLTLGGGILVTVIDLGCLIFSKDISQYENNRSFFMWIKKPK